MGNGHVSKKRRHVRADGGRHTGALLFVCAFLIFAACFGALAAIFLYALPSGTGKSSQKSAFDVQQGVNASDAFNLLLIFSGADSTPAQMTLLRLDTAKKTLDIMPVPLGLRAADDGTIAEAAKSNGGGAAAQALEQAAGIKVDFTCSVSYGSLSRLADLFGGFTCDVPGSVALSQSGGAIQPGNNYIDGGKAQALMTQSGDGAAGYAAQLSLLKAFFEQKLTAYYFDGIDGKSIYGLVSTDFSLNDFLLRADSIRSIASGRDFVVTLTPTCAGDAGVFDTDTIKSIRRYFAD